MKNVWMTMRIFMKKEKEHIHHGGHYHNHLMGDAKLFRLISFAMSCKRMGEEKK